LHGGQGEAGFLRKTLSKAYISEMIGFCIGGQEEADLLRKTFSKAEMYA
jgi:hypothetical protein